MSDDSIVYDLGEIFPETRTVQGEDAIPLSNGEARHERPARGSRIAKQPVEHVEELSSVNHGFDWRGSAELILPGAGHLLRGKHEVGLLVLSSLVSIFVISWALLTNLDRLVPTLKILGLPYELAIWLPAAMVVMAAGIYVTSVFCSFPHPYDMNATRTPYPLVAATASFLIPGWGQFLNRKKLRGIFFLAGVFIVLCAWVLSTPEFSALLSSQQMHLPSLLLLFSGPVVRYTLPAVLWSLAVYDAIVGARQD